MNGNPLRRLCLMGLILAVAPSGAAQTRGALVGVTAPDFTLPTLSGDTLALSATRGHPLVINFWATWCPPCSREMPELVAAQARYAASGLAVVAINLTGQESLGDVRKFVAKLGARFPIPLDRKGRVMRAYDVIALPMTVLVDRQGIVRFVLNGPMSAADLDGRLRELIAMP